MLLTSSLQGPWHNVDKDYFVANPNSRWYTRQPMSQELETLVALDPSAAKDYESLCNSVMDNPNIRTAEFGMLVMLIGNFCKRLPVLRTDHTNSPDIGIVVVSPDGKQETLSPDQYIDMLEKLDDACSKPPTVDFEDRCSHCHMRLRTGQMVFFVHAHFKPYVLCQDCTRVLNHNVAEVKAIASWIRTEHKSLPMKKWPFTAQREFEETRKKALEAEIKMGKVLA